MAVLHLPPPSLPLMHVNMFPLFNGRSSNSTSDNPDNSLQIRHDPILATVSGSQDATTQKEDDPVENGSAEQMSPNRRKKRKIDDASQARLSFTADSLSLVKSQKPATQAETVQPADESRLSTDNGVPQMQDGHKPQQRLSLPAKETAKRNYFDVLNVSASNMHLPRPTNSTQSRETTTETKPKEDSRLVRLKYGTQTPQNQSHFDRVQSIVSSPPASLPPTKPVMEKAVNNKPNHPFFNRNKQQPAATPSAPENGPTRAPLTQPTAMSWTNFSTVSTQKPSLQSASTTRPLWPPRGMVHVRDLGALHSQSKENASSIRRKSSKCKSASVHAFQLESPYMSQLLALKANGFGEPDIRAREPQRKIIAAGDVISFLPSFSQQTLSLVDRQASPCNQKLVDNLPAARSAFDRFQCDQLPWTSKYAPERASEVLSDPSKIEVLKEWLKSAATHSVTHSERGSNTDAGLALKLARRKQRRRQEVDDFIVSSDEESEEEVQSDNLETAQSNLDEEYVQVERRLPNLKTSNLSKTRAVVINGPHGSGKSAAVFAVARELGYEVFEINSGHRRAGKDVMMMVGDMTENHLVSVPGSQETSGGQDDLRSLLLSNAPDPKQRDMKSFFKPGPQSKPKPKTQTKGKNSKATAPPVNKVLRKQSLILLEEVDLLFEEDRGFWSAVTDLILRSKRPVIMTCNDLTSLPIEDLISTRCIEMSRPPLQTVVDHMTLVAAHEGHLISNALMTSLVATHKRDVRAVLNALQFWCQMGVGSQKAGIDWMLLDDDRKSDDLRVISEDTVPPDALESFSVSCNSADADDMMNSSSNDPLFNLADMLDALSVGDVAARIITPHEEQSDIDPATGRLTDKERTNYVDLNPLYQIISKDDCSGVTQDIANYLESRCNLPGKLEACVSLARHHKFGNFCQKTFAPLRESAAHSITTPKHSGMLDFDRGLGVTAVDLAPYIRNIVSFDIRLAEHRQKLSALLSSGGSNGKRQRVTRAARAALEGGHKSSTRRERWFTKKLDHALILKTGGKDWSSLTAAPIENSNDGYHAEPSAWGKVTTDVDVSEDELASLKSPWKKRGEHVGT